MMKRWLRSPLATALLLVLAAGLIGFGGIRAVQAAPRIQSQEFGAQVQLTDISTSLVETNAGGTKTVASSAGSVELLQGLVPKGETFTVGQKYQEELSVVNDGDINQFVRVTVYRYWEGDNGKDVSLDPELIDIEWNTKDWAIDEAASTKERTVLYYQQVLPAGASAVSPLTKSVTIDPAVMDAIGAGGEYEYEGVTFNLEATVDAVQDHNGEQAMTGAWGRTI